MLAVLMADVGLRSGYGASADGPAMSIEGINEPCSPASAVNTCAYTPARHTHHRLSLQRVLHALPSETFISNIRKCFDELLRIQFNKK